MAEPREPEKAGGGARSTSGNREDPAASRGSASRSAAGKEGGQARGRRQTAGKAADSAARAATPRAAGVEAKTVAELREALRRSLIRPGGMMLLSRDRIEEALGEAVKRGQAERATSRAT